MSFSLKIHIISLFVFLLFPLIVYCQEFETPSTIEDIIEEISASTDNEIDFTDLIEDLNFFKENPLNINSATASDLEKFQFLNEIQISSLLAYRNTYGIFRSLTELLLVEGFTEQTISWLKPFILVENIQVPEELSFRTMLYKGRHNILIKTQEVLEKQKAYLPISDSALAASPNSRYLGSPEKIYFRYSYHCSDRIYAGFKAEKDAGEEFFAGNQKHGFDFYSGYFQINRLWMFKTIVVGDFDVNFGQGLVAWTGFSMTQSPGNVNSILRSSPEIKKYTSTDENFFLRGIASTIKLGKLELTTFASRKKIDANISAIDTLTNETEIVSSFQTSGLHTIPSEIEDKDAVTETVSGSNITYKTEMLKTGFSFIHYNFDSKFESNQSVYNMFDFNGNENWNAGFNYQFTYKNFCLFGEEATCENGSFAFVNGAIFSPASQVSFSLIYRDFPKKYQARFASPFMQSSEPSNEKGIYSGMEVFIARGWKFSVSTDFVRHDWLSYYTDSPSNESKIIVQTDCLNFENWNFYFRYSRTEKSENDNVETVGMNQIIGVKHEYIRLQLNYDISESLKAGNRIEISRYKPEDESVSNGYLIYQDVKYKPSDNPFSCSARFSIFDTESYDSRIYTYENDLIYEFSVPSFYSKGTRVYITGTYDINRYLTFGFKFSQTYYSDKETIGSGLSEISGQTKSEVKAMLHIKF